MCRRRRRTSNFRRGLRGGRSYGARRRGRSWNYRCLSGRRLGRRRRLYHRSRGPGLRHHQPRWWRRRSRLRGNGDRCRRCRRSRSRGRCWFFLHRRRWCGTRRRSGRSLLLVNKLQHVAGLGDVRQVNLGLDLVRFSARCATGLGRGLSFGGSLKVGAHFFSLMILNGTGVSLLLRYTDQSQHIENGLAFDFELSCQIVDSNLTHPPSCSSAMSATRSCQPHGISGISRGAGPRKNLSRLILSAPWKILPPE